MTQLSFFPITFRDGLVLSLSLLTCASQKETKNREKWTALSNIKVFKVARNNRRVQLVHKTYQLMLEKKKAMRRWALLPFLACLAWYSYICEMSTENSTTRRTVFMKMDRLLTNDLGNGNCEWQPPLYDIPEEIDFYKTAIVGFPSGDKRMIFVQMEALTNWGQYILLISPISCKLTFLTHKTTSHI